MSDAYTMLNLLRLGGWLLFFLALHPFLWSLSPGRAESLTLSALSQAADPTPVITTPTPTRPPYLVATPTPSPTPAPEFESTLPADGEDRIYQVEEGDTILDVALEVGLDLDDAYCLVAPSFDRSEPLIIGDRLVIPNYPFICHRVQDGETLEAILAGYAVEPASIIEDEWNELGEDLSLDFIPETGIYLRVRLAADYLPPSLPVDDQGFFPLMLSQPVGTSSALVSVVGAAMAETDLQAVGGPGQLHQTLVPADWPYGSGAFAWPMFGWLTQGYAPDHRAIDIAAPSGTLVTAADRGVVKRAGWNSQGYGLFVIIDHNIDYLTLYSHLSEVLVEEGQIVAKGEALGRVGSTGNSTGPHLHFELRDFGYRTDPIPLLVD